MVKSDGSNVDPAASLPLRDDDDEFRELTLAQRGMASAPAKILYYTILIILLYCYSKILFL